MARPAPRVAPATSATLPDSGRAPGSVVMAGMMPGAADKRPGQHLCSTPPRRPGALLSVAGRAGDGPGTGRVTARQVAVDLRIRVHPLLRPSADLPDDPRGAPGGEQPAGHAHSRRHCGAPRAPPPGTADRAAEPPAPLA